MRVDEWTNSARYLGIMAGMFQWIYSMNYVPRKSDYIKAWHWCHHVYLPSVQARPSPINVGLTSTWQRTPRASYNHEYTRS